MKVYEIIKAGRDTYRFHQALQGAIADLSHNMNDKIVLVRSIDFAEIYEDPASRLENIKSADFVVAYMGEEDQNIIYELGVADALRKPMILVVDDANVIPYMFVGRRLFVIPKSELRQRSTRNALFSVLNRAIEKSEEFVLWGGEATEESRVSAFVSYSHADRDCLNRLLVHVKPLERLSLIDVWSDKRIAAGDDWLKEIKVALAKARIAVLLISADFLASDFIVNDELPPLLDAARLDGVKILPVILSPCRFTRDPSLRVFQAANDPADPLRGMSSVDQEGLYNKVASDIEDLVNRKDEP